MALRKRLHDIFGATTTTPTNDANAWRIPIVLIEMYAADRCPPAPVLSKALLADLALCAAAPSSLKLRLLSWNVLIDEVKGMHTGVSGSNGRFARIRAEIERLKPDIGCLQEVTPTSIEPLLGKDVAATVDFAHRMYGQVTTSTDARVRRHVVGLDSDSWKGKAPKRAPSHNKHVEVAVLPHLSVAVCNVHFSAGFKNIDVRIGELLRTIDLVETMRARGVRHVFVAGDWNCISRMKRDQPLWTAEPRLLPAHWTELGPRRAIEATVDPASNPLSKRLTRTGLASQLDHIFYCCGHVPASCFTCEVIKPEGECSDHYPLLVDVSI
jgi:endonuclease/exonuclease/phosphatase family metal-dependent hydrolase